MINALLVNCYLLKLLARVDYHRLCGTDLSDKDTAVQISYNILENLIRGLLILQRPTHAPYCLKTLKLYSLLQAQIGEAPKFSLRDSTSETTMLARFFTYKLTADDRFDLKFKSEPLYHIARCIFTSFFAAC